jgi:hypothetical protein
MRRYVGYRGTKKGEDRVPIWEGSAVYFKQSGIDAGRKS